MTSAMTAVGFAGGLGWIADLAAHFRVQYCGGLLAAAVVVAVARRRRLALVFAAMGAINLATIVPFYLPRAPLAPTPHGSPVRFLQLNVRVSNTRYDLVEAEIARTDPDVLVLQELSPAWSDALGATLRRYPHRAVRTRTDNFGIGVYSRIPMQGTIVDLGDSSLPTVVATLDGQGGAFTLIATHPLPPIGSASARRRDRQLGALADRVAGATGPVIVIGDLNATPWSAAFRALLRDANLRDASRGRGVHATWPANLPLMRIPIDQCLYTGEVMIVAEHVGGDVGSDHYPLVVEALVGVARESR